MNIIILGTGPVGLYTAIRAQQKFGKLATVYVADPRLNRYEKPGIIANMAVDNINNFFDRQGIPLISVPDSGAVPTNTVMLDDLRNTLLETAQSYNIIFLAARFQSIHESNVVLQTNLNEEQILACDLLIDASGGRRIVANYANQAVPNTFEIKSIAQNPIKNHFIAYVHMDAENAKKTLFKDLRQLDPLGFMQHLVNLQQEFGWESYAVPEIYKYMWSEKQGSRFCFYFEIPASLIEDVTFEQQERYLKALLKLKTEEDIDFVRETGKLKFVPFEVEHQIVTDPINLETFSFPVALVGDAHMSPEYRFGTGVTNGVTCAEGLIDSIEIKAGKPKIHKGLQQQLTGSKIATHTTELKEATRKKNLELNYTALCTAQCKYIQAYNTETFEADPTLAHAFLNLAVRMKDSANEFFKEAQQHNKNTSAFKESLKKAKDLYIGALQLYEKYSLATDTEEKWSQIIKILSNLSKMEITQSNYDSALTYARQALALSKTQGVPLMQASLLRTLGRIMEEQCKAACSKLDKHKDASLILEKNKQLAEQRVALSQDSAIDSTLQKTYLKEALSFYLASDSEAYIAEKELIYSLLITAEEAQPTPDLEAIEQYKTKLHVVLSQKYKQSLQEKQVDESEKILTKGTSNP